MEKNKWHLGKITFLTVLDNFVPLTNNAFKISKEAQVYECVHPLIKVTFSAGYFFIPIICGSQNIGSNVIFLLKPRNFSWKCFCISKHNAITLQQVFGFLEEILWLDAPGMGTLGTDIIKWNRLAGILLPADNPHYNVNFFFFTNCKPEQISPWSLIQTNTFVLLCVPPSCLKKILPLFTPDSKPSLFNPVWLLVLFSSYCFFCLITRP